MEWLNYHHLRYFWAAAREGSVTRAAERLGRGVAREIERRRESRAALRPARA